MVKDLSTLLRESAAHPPADHGAVSDLTEVVRRGRSRVRRRRVVAAGGAVASVAVIAVGGALLTPGGAGGDGVVEPAKQIAPVGPVVHPEDSVSGVPGRDWTSLTALSNHNLDRANGQYLSGYTADGLVLVKDGPHGRHNRSRWGLMDPATGETAWLSDPSTADLERPIGFGEGRIVFVGSEGRRSAVVIHDRDSGGWSVPMKLPGDPWGLVSAQLGPDNRVYFGLDPEDTGRQQQLWSLSLDTPDEEARDEGRTVGDFTISGDNLIYTATNNEPNDRITVVDLTTGEEHSFDPQSGDRCNQLSLQAAGDHVVMGQYCGTTNGGRSPVRDDRVQVVDLEGDPVVTVQGHGVTAGAVAPDGFVVGAYGSVDDRDGATYVWSFADRTLMRVAGSMSKFSMPWLDGDALMWHESVNDTRGARQFVATLK